MPSGGGQQPEPHPSEPARLGSVVAMGGVGSKGGTVWRQAAQGDRVESNSGSCSHHDGPGCVMADAQVPWVNSALSGSTSTPPGGPSPAGT
jgi:hypothetical protein